MSAISDLVDSAISGKRSALARLLSIAENNGPELIEIEDCLSATTGNSLVVGITGPPGAGKSTLINAILPHAIDAFGNVAVLAVDPSSPFTDGAILGDRVRMQAGSFGSSAFIRSMASRGELGGLARTISTSVRLFDACDWPIIFIETLGIGQVELDIMNLADTTLVVLNPLWGDSIQANKAGITEAGDIFVINKADKPGVQQTKNDLQDSLALLDKDPKPTVLESTATTTAGVDDLWDAICDHQKYLQSDNELIRQREQKRYNIVRKTLADQIQQKVDNELESDFGEKLLAEITLGELNMEKTLEQLLRNLLRRIS